MRENQDLVLRGTGSIPVRRILFFFFFVPVLVFCSPSFLFIPSALLLPPVARRARAPSSVNARESGSRPSGHRFDSCPAYSFFVLLRPCPCFLLPLLPLHSFGPLASTRRPPRPGQQSG